MKIQFTLSVTKGSGVEKVTIIYGPNLLRYVLVTGSCNLYYETEFTFEVETNPGYTFEGAIYNLADYNDESFDPSQKLTNSFEMGTENIDLIVVAKSNKYEITYDVNGGDEKTLENQTVWFTSNKLSGNDEVTSVTLNDGSTLKRDGFLFIGWSKILLNTGAALERYKCRKRAAP